MEFKAEWFEAACDITGDYEILESLRPYSGRAMYGKQCPAVSVDDGTQAFKLVAAMGMVQVQLEADGADDVPDALEFASQMCQDSLGLGLVVYWPRMELDAYPDDVAD